MQNIILLRALNLTYAKESKKFMDRMLGREGGLLLKDVTFHLYKGEVLGIFSDYRTLNYLKEMVNGSLDPKKGRVKTDSSILSLDVLDHISHPHPLNIFVSEMLDEYMQADEAAEAVEQLWSHPLFRKYWNTPVKEMTRREIALVLLEMSNVSDAEIILYCNVYRHLGTQDATVFKSTINGQEEKGRGVLLLESSMEPIESLANYFLWLSYGQVRYDGSVKQGIMEYNDHMKKKSQLKSVDEEAHFDIEWKRNLDSSGKYAHGLKRLSRKQSGLIDTLNMKKIILSLILMFTMLMASIVIFMDISFTGSANTGQEQTVAAPEEEKDNRIAYAVVSEENLEVNGESYPYLSLLQVSDRSGETYTILDDGTSVEMDGSSFIYFNPASLYPETTLEALLPYTDEVFENNYLYYSRVLNGETERLTDEMNLSASSARHADLSGIPISYQFKDGLIFSMSFPSRDMEGMYEAFGITTEDVIFRLPEGYMILDASNQTWLYIQR
ncbi:hypothetical protein [Salinicoccus roseus]|uniref:hypothetical protein n=1 Tax=Salinicoccus roseus TaxID=45670 RepID=UPI001EF5E865|nr:hypothetical protein [Salinicoccus roseus]MCG7333310.1 hypothetical protein [Salinicoccus roseus]